MFGKKHAAESGKKKYLYMFEEGNKDMRELLGGKGGGKPDSAMGGGTELLKVDDALAAVDDFVSEKIS